MVASCGTEGAERGHSTEHYGTSAVMTHSLGPSSIPHQRVFCRNIYVTKTAQQSPEFDASFARFTTKLIVYTKTHTGAPTHHCCFRQRVAICWLTLSIAFNRQIGRYEFGKQHQLLRFPLTPLEGFNENGPNLHCQLQSSFIPSKPRASLLPNLPHISRARLLEVSCIRWTEPLFFGSEETAGSSPFQKMRANHLRWFHYHPVTFQYGTLIMASLISFSRMLQ